jgi:S1-C subfamily serine protease
VDEPPAEETPPKATLSLVHLSGPRRGQTDAVERLPAAIGSEAACAVVVPGVAPHHAQLVAAHGEVLLEDSGSGRGTLLLGEYVQRGVLRDGDVIELGAGGPKLRFRDVAGDKPPLLEALAWARPEGAPQSLADTTGFFRAVVRETAERTTRLFRVSVAVILALGLGAALYSQWHGRRLRQEMKRLREAVATAQAQQQEFVARIAEERRRSDEEKQRLEAEIQAARARASALDQTLREAQSAEDQAVREDLRLTRERLATLESERAAGERIIRNYGGGVALVQGSYAYYDALGRPLRLSPGEDGEPRRKDDGSLLLSPEATGPVYASDYFGTGFLVDRKGLLLTNRHVAEPWWNDDTAERLGKEGFKPRFTTFRAFFPQEAEAFELRTERVSQKFDLAVVSLDLRKRKVPVLALDATGKGAVPGQPVVVLGYPAGLEALLAKAETSLVRQILTDNGMSPERVTEALGRKGLIRPSTTQGHIGDVTNTDIVFDAPTTQGGSGGPVLNKNGRVIAVEYAVLSKFEGSSFGVPIGYALELLKAPPRPGAHD